MRTPYDSILSPGQLPSSSSSAPRYVAHRYTRAEREDIRRRHRQAMREARERDRARARARRRGGRVDGPLDDGAGLLVAGAGVLVTLALMWVRR